VSRGELLRVGSGDSEGIKAQLVALIMDQLGDQIQRSFKLASSADEEEAAAVVAAAAAEEAVFVDEDAQEWEQTAEPRISSSLSPQGAAQEPRGQAAPVGVSSPASVAVADGGDGGASPVASSTSSSSSGDDLGWSFQPTGAACVAHAGAGLGSTPSPPSTVTASADDKVVVDGDGIYGDADATATGTAGAGAGDGDDGSILSSATPGPVQQAAPAPALTTAATPVTRVLATGDAAREKTGSQAEPVTEMSRADFGFSDDDEGDSVSGFGTESDDEAVSAGFGFSRKGGSSDDDFEFD
jgi:hypothetical protein